MLYRLQKTFFISLTGLLFFVLSLSASAAFIQFDNTGAEAGITVPNTFGFSLFGATFSGGAVAVLPTGSVNSPPAGFVDIDDTPAEQGMLITFDVPVFAASFLFIDLDDDASTSFGAAAIIDSTNVIVASALSHEFSDANRFVLLSSPTPFNTIFLEGGLIDDFNFSTSTVPLPAAIWLMMTGILMLSGFRRRYPAS